MASFLLVLFALLASSRAMNLNVNLTQNLDVYIKNRLEGMRSTLIKGYPALNITPIDPLRTNEIKMNIKKTIIGQDFDIKVVFKNIAVKGLSKYTVDKVDANYKNLELDLLFKWPRTVLTADYSMSGLIDKSVPLFGRGGCEMVFDGLFMGVDGFLSIAENKIKVDRLDIDIDFKDLKTNFETLEGGGRLGKAGNLEVNYLATYMYHKFKPQIMEKIDMVLRNHLNKKLATMDAGKVMENIVKKLEKRSIEEREIKEKEQ